MLDPYRMVVINLIASVLLIVGIIIYKYVYPKRNINLLFLLILISLLPIISIFRKGTYESGDLTLHTGFAMTFYESLQDGNIIPRWSSKLIYEYGYPLFILIYPLPYYIASIFHFLGLGFIASIKLVLVLSFILSGVAMYLWTKDELKNNLSAFTAAIFYLFAPYHLVDMHFRVAIGEAVSFALLPFCFLSVKKLSVNKSFKWFILSSISYSLLVLSHQAISFFSFPFIIGYCFFLWLRRDLKKIQYLSYYVFSIIAGLLLSSFYWLPLILEAKYTSIPTKGTIFFPQLHQFLYSPWRWGFLFQGPKGELSFILGYVHWFVVILSIILFFKYASLHSFIYRIFIFYIKPKQKTSLKLNRLFKKTSIKENQLYLVTITSFSIIFIMMQSLSNPIWMGIPLLRGAQFSYRLLIFSLFFSSIIAGIVVKNINKKIFFIGLCLITVFTTILNWGNRRTIPEINDQVIRSGLSTIFNDAGPGTAVWFEYDKLKIGQKVNSHIDIIEGKTEIVELSRNSVKHEYLIDVKTDSARVKENTMYFPNWIVKVNNDPHPFSFKDPVSPGVIIFNLSKGLYKVEVIFTDTGPRVISKWISFVTLLFMALYAINSYLTRVK